MRCCGAQVLSVDDEPINQEVLQALLWATDYVVTPVVRRGATCPLPLPETSLRPP